MFLSRGYFFSANARRELVASEGCDAALVLLHEWDTSRGGQALSELREECPLDLVSFLRLLTSPKAA